MYLKCCLPHVSLSGLKHQRAMCVCLLSGDVITYNSKSNILKTEAAQTKLLPAQRSTTKNRLFGVTLEYVGVLSNLRMTYKYYFNI